MEPAKKLHPGITALIVIVLIAIAATAAIVINGAANNKTNTVETPQTTQQTEGPQTGTSTSTADYKDGTYKATGSYSSPGGLESIDLTVTIKDGVITDTSLVTNAKSGDAKNYQAEFASAYKGLIVGKDVERVTLSRVAGSSLTSNGFNRALEQIRTDAKA